MTQTGFPHSEISGLTVVCTYPKLIAACHVLHRLHVPRHPPYALSSFTKGSWSREWSLFIKINKDSQLFSVTKWSYRLPQIAEDDSHLWIDINSQFSKNNVVELTGIEPATFWMHSEGRRFDPCQLHHIVFWKLGIDVDSQMWIVFCNLRKAVTSFCDTK